MVMHATKLYTIISKLLDFVNVSLVYKVVVSTSVGRHIDF